MAARGGIQRIFRILCVSLILAGGLVPAWNWYDTRKTAALAAACRAAILEEQWDAAQSLAEQWVSRSPQDGQAWLSLADVAKHRGDLAATAECLGRIPTTDESYLNTQMLRGDLLLDGLKRPDEAVAVWKAMLAVSPQANVAYQRLLYVYSMTLQRELLVKQIRVAMQNHAEPPEAYGYILTAPNLVFTDGYVKVGQWLQSNPDDETLKVAQAVFAARTNPSKGMKMFGKNAVEMGDASRVMECLKEYPDNLELRAFVIEKAIGDADMAALGLALQKLPTAAENDSRFWRYIGTFRDSQRRPQEAAEAFQQSVKLHPLDWKSHHELGAIERVLGHAELAAKHAELGARGKQLEREFMELPNATQADSVLLEKLLSFAKDCGDPDVVNGLTYRLQEPGSSAPAAIP